MSEHGVTEAGTIVFQRLLPGPIERVWAYLTESDKRGRWLASGEMELKPGGKVELQFLHAGLSEICEAIPDQYKGMEGGASFTGHVTRCEPPRLLAFTWAESWGDDSEVTFELETRDDKVRLLLTHRRLDDTALVSVASGWHTHLDILQDELEGRTRQPFWSTHAEHEAEYMKRLSK